MNALIAASSCQTVFVQKVLLRSLSSQTPMLPAARRACCALRSDHRTKDGKYLHLRMRRRVTETLGMALTVPRHALR
jgi:hypothetical protein